jgi:pyruvate/2-oxoglutarate dehydrogenase complex dihydrolipoamide dehydrogenase (E3) component
MSTTSSAADFDVVVLGMGPGGEVAAARLLESGRRVAVVERELIGGECAYWACVPSKTLLRPPEIKSEARHAAGTGTPELDWAAVRDYRDFMIRNLDDSNQVKDYEEHGATVIKGHGRLAGKGQVDVDGRILTTEHVIVATGSDPRIPPIQGTENVPVWTNREATTLREIPGRVLMIGGGPVGIELGQFLARFGTHVTLVQSADRLIPREDPRVSELTLQALESDGIDVRVGRQLSRIRRDGSSGIAELDDGSKIAIDVVVIGAGRTPRTQDLGLETIGVKASPRGLPVDQRCRVTEGVWALGDVTGVILFTHVAKYQGRVVADNLLGNNRLARYQGIPRVVFSDPEVAAVGLTQQQAQDQGLHVATATVDLPAKLARPWTYEQHPRGELGLVADQKRRVLVGAWAVAPLASEWIHQAALAIRAQIPIDTLLDSVAQFPTYSEGYLKAAETLGL